MHIFTYDTTNGCFRVTIDDKQILVDNENLEHVICPNKPETVIWKIDKSGLVYTHNANSKKVYLYRVLGGNSDFANNDLCDYRLANIIQKEKLPPKITNAAVEIIDNNVKPAKNDPPPANKPEKKNNTRYVLPTGLTILQSFPGHLQKYGHSAGTMHNPYWLVQSDTDKFYVMYCEPNTYVYFSEDMLEKITYNEETNKVPTWFVGKNGHVATVLNTQIYMHQVVMNHFAKKDGSELSVDHINKNKLDNRTSNLRLVTQAEQNSKIDKRKRNHNARVLPPEIAQIELPKYVIYYKEKVSKNPDRYREFFRIEKHPKQGPTERWASTKSNQISILEKLEATKEKLNNLNAV